VYNDKIAQRFWSKVDKTDGCWNWKAAVWNGYGNFRVKSYGSMARSHRVAWELTFGEIPDRMCVCHKCDNRICCNPSHLFLGTQGDNVRDMDLKGRRGKYHGQYDGERGGKVKLNELQVRIIRRFDEEPRILRQIDVADIFNVTQATVWRIFRGITWKHLNRQAASQLPQNEFLRK
jgi:hypothetical protein